MEGALVQFGKYFRNAFYLLFFWKKHVSNEQNTCRVYAANDDIMSQQQSYTIFSYLYAFIYHIGDAIYIFYTYRHLAATAFPLLIFFTLLGSICLVYTIHTYVYYLCKHNTLVCSADIQIIIYALPFLHEFQKKFIFSMCTMHDVLHNRMKKSPNTIRYYNADYEYNTTRFSIYFTSYIFSINGLERVNILRAFGDVWLIRDFGNIYVYY